MTGDEPRPEQQPGQPAGHEQPGQPPGHGQAAYYEQPGYYEQAGYSGYPYPGYPPPGPPGYYPQPGYTVYPYPPPYQPADSGARNLSIAALITNIVVSVLCCPVFGIAGIVLSGIAMSRADQDPIAARKLVIWAWAALAASIVTGITAFALIIILAPET